MQEESYNPYSNDGVKVNNFDFNKQLISLKIIERNPDEHFPIDMYSILYNNNPFTFKTEYIKLTEYGIPRKQQYYHSDVQRPFIYVTLNNNQKSCVDLEKFLEKIDNYFGSDEFKTEFFKKKINKYNYIPCVKKTTENSYDVDNGINHAAILKKNNSDPHSCKFKFKFITKDGVCRNISKITHYGKKITVSSIDEIKKYIRIKSSVQFTVSFQKMWVGKYLDNKNYGINFTIDHAVVGKTYNNNNIYLPTLDAIKTYQQDYIQKNTFKLKNIDILEL